MRRLDGYTACVHHPTGIKKLSLTMSEHKLLARMAESPGRAIQRAELIDACFTESMPLETTINTHMHNLRRKLNDAGARAHLAPVRGFGYRLEKKLARSLNVQIIRTMCVVAIVDFITMVFAAVPLIFMVEWLQEWLQVELNDMYEWFYLIISISVGLIPGVVVGWRLAHKIMRPLKSVATAVRSIASGDFSARAKATQSSLSEAEALIVDFNAMAARLERAEEELKYSSSATAHELRTPLTVLLASLQGLSDGVVEPSSELYELLICQVTDVTGMVEDLRTFDLANAGTLEIDLQEVDLRA
ncbi:winged helix-turn-helix domain-containing protein [Sinorhizobium medicae]